MCPNDSYGNKFNSRILQNSLRYWPYTIHQIDDTLDSALIEGRGKQILFQSLNSRSITAFVGSGISAAYGRMSWSGWKDAQLAHVERVSSSFLKVSKHAIDCLTILTNEVTSPEDDRDKERDVRLTQRWLLNRRQMIERARWDVQNLVRTFDAAKSEKGSFPGGEDLPIVFEIGKRLHDLLLQHNDLFFGKNDRLEPPDVPPAVQRLVELLGRLKIKADIQSWTREDDDLLTFVFATRILRSTGAPIENIPGFVAWAGGGVFIKKAFRDFRRALLTLWCNLDRHEAQVWFDVLAKSLLVDEVPHAFDLLVKGLAREPVTGGDGSALVEAERKLIGLLGLRPKDNLKRNLDGIRERPERYAVLTPFNVEKLKSKLRVIAQNAPDGWADILTDTVAYWEVYLDEDGQAPLDPKRLFLTPTSRFVLSMALQLLKNPHDGAAGGLTDDDFTPPDPDDFKARRSIIATRLDPLEKISEHLGIRRYLTTNYDFEIERFFQDKGYRRFDAHRALLDGESEAAEDPLHFRTNGLGGVMRDMTFQSATATDLLSFATSSGGADVSIFHLHGRATRDDKIVVTERDYMNLYLRQDPDREVVDESILMAFAATPILFLGLGMEEADILRPLRQFMSDQDRSVGYRAIVLLPADKDFDSRAKTAAGLYMRYGAHTIFYGSGDLPDPDADPNGRAGSRQSVDWFYRIVALIGKLKSAIESVAEDITDDEKTFNKPIVDFADLAKAVGNLGPDLLPDERNEDAKSEPALRYLLGIPRNEWDTAWAVLDPDSSRADEDKQTALETLVGPHTARAARRNILNCRYTAYRHQNIEADHENRAIFVEGARYTSFYIARLSDMMHLALRTPNYANRDDAQRSLTAMLTALNGLQGAIMTATLNAALESIHLEWQHWWKDWQASPPQREPRFEQLPRDPLPPSKPECDREKRRRQDLLLPPRDVRHKIESVITDLRDTGAKTAPAPLRPDGGTGPFHAFTEADRTGVRIFDRFIDDIAAVGKCRAQPTGRVVTTVAANRGRGKGVFFSTFASRLGLSSYMRAMHPGVGAASADTPIPVFTRAIFVNLSFSSEIASIYDMTVDALRTAVAQLRVLKTDAACSIKDFELLETFLHRAGPMAAVEEPAELKAPRDALAKELKEIDDSIAGLPRYDKFRHLMAAYAKTAKVLPGDPMSAPIPVAGRVIAPRVLIAINAVDLLFDAQRRPKNLELADYLRFFSSAESRDYPMDFVGIGAFGAMGHFWQSDGDMFRVTCAWDHLPLTARAEVDTFAKAAGVACLPSLKARHPRRATADLMDPSRINYVHFAGEIDPIRFLVDNFPTLAIALMLARLRRDARLEGWKTGKLDCMARRAWHTMVQKRQDTWGTEFNPPDANDLYFRTRGQLHQEIAKYAARALRELPKGIQSQKVSTRLDLSSVEALLDPMRAFWSHDDPSESLTTLSRVLAQTFAPKSTSSDADDWRELTRALSGNRFCLTILMAAAEHLIFSKRHFIDGGDAADQMLSTASSVLRNVGAGRREEEVLATVMTVYRHTAQVGDAEQDHELHQLLLRNIAVLGCPVTPNVLVRFPDIREYFGRVAARAKMSRRRMVAQALAALAERGLIFRISPHPKLTGLQAQIKAIEEILKRLGKDGADFANYDSLGDALNAWDSDLGAVLDPALLNFPYEQYDRFHKVFADWPAGREYRYALHRQIQSYCFHRLGHLSAPPVTANSFAPTLYASMPSRVVRLSTEAYLFLRRLLLGLSQYPDIRHQDAARALPIFRDDDIVTRVQALRAAMSLARTCFSIAAVSRFDNETTGLDFIRKRGHFETYRVRLRWILRMAWEVHEPRNTKGESSIDRHRVNALYLDEIVWLYNEVAVTCLVQGALTEAIGHARQAMYLNRQIEGEAAGGRMHNMLSLNLAIIQIERGRLRSAEARLRAIVASEGTRGRTLSMLAQGYLALSTQLGGRSFEADEMMKSVIDTLERRNEDRALALMMHHRARLVAKTDLDTACDLMKRARDYAEKGGHEDVRHRILVGEVWISQEFQPDPHTRMEDDRVKLREAQRYAEIMGLDSLLVESLHAQGKMLLEAGDYSSSGRLMTKAMAISRRNDMTLRLNTIMTNYARVLLARRRVASAKRLLEAALSMAKRSGYTIEVVRIHRVQDKVEQQTSVADDP